MLRINSYEASSLNDHVMPYRCVHCGYQTIARAFAYAKGTGLSPYGIDDAGAERRALSAADANARAQAIRSIRLAPCPSCRRRDRSVLVRAYRDISLRALAILAAIIGPLCLVAPWGSAMILGLFAGGPVSLMYWNHRISALTSRAVRFDALPATTAEAAAADAELAALGVGKAALPTATVRASKSGKGERAE